MDGKKFNQGLILLGTGFLDSSLSSFVNRMTLLGNSTKLIQGFFDGLAVVAFCAALFLMLRSR